MTSLVMSRMSADTVPISGRQTTLRCGPYTAEIASVGASLRSLRYNGRDLILPFSEHQVRPAYRGAVLVPWPNRVIA
jgi:aldose 1-epimerase